MIFRNIPFRHTAIVITLAVLIVSGQTGCKGKAGQSAGDNQGQVATSNIPGSSYTDQEMLNEASLSGETAVVAALIQQGADVNYADEGGRTALMLAAFNGHTDIVRMLHDSGALTDALDTVGRTALLYCASGPFPETIELLLEREANPNTVDKLEHFTALMHAAAEGHLDVVKVLLEHGADPSLTDIDGDTAESFARQGNHIAVAELLKSHISLIRNE